MTKKDRLLILKERLKSEELYGDKFQLSKIVGCAPQLVSRVLAMSSYSELKTIKQQNIVTEFLRLLNERKSRESDLDVELTGKE